MRIECRFVDKCGQALRQCIVVLCTQGQSMLSIVRIIRTSMRREYPFQPVFLLEEKQKLSEDACRKYAHSYV